MNGMTALEIKELNKKALMDIPGVVGVGMSRGSGERINIYVESMTPDILGKVPQTLDGFPVTVINAGKIMALPLLPMQIPKALVEEREQKMRPSPCGISIGNMCYSKDTRVLTKDGLKYFYDLTPKDKIATLNSNTKELEWQKTLNIFTYDYDGDMLRFCGNTLDLLVTPNHYVYCRNRHKKEDFKLIKAEDALKLIPHHNIQFKRNCEWNCSHMSDFSLPMDERTRIYEEFENWDGTQTDFMKNNDVTRHTLWNWENGRTKPKYLHSSTKFDIDDWLELLGWYLSEGSTNVRQIAISEKSGQYHNEIKSLLKRMKVGCCTDKNKNIRIPHKWLTKYFNDLKLCGAKNKYIPREFKELPPEKLMILLTALMKGDGHFEKGKFRHYKTVSWKLANDVLEIGLKCGFGVTISECITKSHEWNGRIIKGGKCYRIGFSHIKLTPRLANPIETIKYNDKIYCVEVPNHVLFVERNGKTCWSGNSITAGTQGTIFRDNITGRRVILSNAHVLTPDPSKGTADETRIVQPGVADGGTEADIIANLTRYVQLDTTGNNTVDCAIATPLNDADISDEIMGIGVPAGIATADFGHDVQKSGRTTAVTSDVIIDTSADVRVGYSGGWEATFSDCYVTGHMADGGDSGSALLDMNNNIVGLLFAGSANLTVHCKIQNVMDALNISLTGEGPAPPPPNLASMGWLALGIGGSYILGKLLRGRK